jgi:carotenoid cleavage dioxygenase-like enzyme
LNGRYLRNGSNPIGEIDPDFYHWFIGDGMVRGIRIRDGKAEWYRNRWVRAPSASKALGERSRDGHFGFYSIGANTNVIGHAGNTLALIEAGIACYELTDELDTVGVCRETKQLATVSSEFQHEAISRRNGGFVVTFCRGARFFGCHDVSVHRC